MEIKTALFKLAFFEPNLKDENNNHILDYLILDCLSAYSPMYDCGLDEISRYIKTTFSVEFDEAEILAASIRLESKELAIVNEPNNKNEIQRVRLIKSLNINNQQKIKDLEEKVFADWSLILKEKYKNYVNDNSITKIIESFQSFLTKLLIRHGKESVATLYPDNPKTQEWIEKIQDEIIKDLPKLGNELDIILQIEIPLFFKTSEKSRQEYLNNLFNASFLWHLMQIDESCTEYFKKTTRGQLLVLDNNILYSLIGLHGPQLLSAMHNLLNYANQLGYKLTVTTKTLDEFYQSIQSNSEKAFGYSKYSKDIANVAIKVLDPSNYLVAYWNDLVKNGLTIEEFAIEKSHIKNILDAFNIAITNEFREEIESSQELLDEESLLRQSCGDNFSQSIIEHDAFHRILIRKLRQNFKYKYSEAKAWFLTHDSKLPVYARFALKGSKALPFCISTNEWIQINRPFLIRTQSSKEFEDSFQLLVTQPFLRSVLVNFKVDKIKEKLLSNLNRYQNIGSQLAFDLVTDVHFLHTLSKQTNNEQFEAKIEEAIININENLKEENREIYEVLEKQESDHKEQIDTLEERINEIHSQLIKSNENQSVLLESFKDINSTLIKTKAENANKDNEINSLTLRLLKQKKIFVWSLFAIATIVGLIFIWFFGKFIEWNWLETKQTKVLLKICASFLLLSLNFNISLPKHWVIWLSTAIAFIIALLSIAAI